MSELYDRRWRILVSKDGMSALDVSQLDIEFSVEKSMGDNGNSGDVTIYNLSTQSIKSQISEGSRVIIEAGYQNGPYGIIFDGDTVDCTHFKDGGVTRVLNLFAKDGDIFLNGTFISESFSAGMTTESLLKSFDGKGGVELGDVSADFKNTQLPRGRVLHGSPKQILNALAKSEGGRAYISDRKIHLIKADDPPKGQIISLTPETGLIGSPKQTEDGNVEAVCLLNPQINLNKFVHIKSDNIIRQVVETQASKATAELLGSGVYRIIKIKYKGNTRGNDWYAEFTGVPQPGITVSNNTLAR